MSDARIETRLENNEERATCFDVVSAAGERLADRSARKSCLQTVGAPVVFLACLAGGIYLAFTYDNEAAQQEIISALAQSLNCTAHPATGMEGAYIFNCIGNNNVTNELAAVRESNSYLAKNAWSLAGGILIAMPGSVLGCIGGYFFGKGLSNGIDRLLQGLQSIQCPSLPSLPSLPRLSMPQMPSFFSRGFTRQHDEPQTSTPDIELQATVGNQEVVQERNSGSSPTASASN